MKGDIEQVPLLLREMMQSLRQCEDTPLQFGIDAPRIAAAALARVPLIAGTEAITRVLDQVVRDALEGVWPDDVESTVAEELPVPVELHSCVSTWLEEAHARLYRVHPSAPVILALRLECEASRDIAERLGLGLRLVRRILSDMRSSFAEVTA